METCGNLNPVVNLLNCVSMLQGQYLQLFWWSMWGVSGWNCPELGSLKSVLEFTQRNLHIFRLRKQTQNGQGDPLGLNSM